MGGERIAHHLQARCMRPRPQALVHALPAAWHAHPQAGTAQPPAANGTAGDAPPAHGDAGWGSSLFHHHHPGQHRHHPGYRYMLSKKQRQNGISHYGSAERLRAALSRAITRARLVKR
jgi:hypothetical protein